MNYRKTSDAIHNGRTIHFSPDKGIYTLFRISGDEIVALILNKNESTSVDLSKYEEIGLQGKTVRNIITDKELVWDTTLKLDSKGIIFLTTKK